MCLCSSCSLRGYLRPQVMNMASLMDRLPHAYLLMCYCFTFVSVYGLGPELTVPQQVSLSSDMSTQQLSISWLGGAATTFDLMILRTELNETVIYETVSVPVNLMNGHHQWNWTSVEPLECTSLSVQIRSRDGQLTSEWSNTQILQGRDLPSNEKFQMYPQDRVLPVGANITFCCIVEEGKFFGTMYTVEMGIMNTIRLSRRSYATTLVVQRPSGLTGDNILCYNNLKTVLTGAVMFVGYPPLPTDFVCETRDLASAVCQWNEGRHTHMYGKRGTFYSVNKSPKQSQRGYTVNQWEGNWTLVAVNRLGQYSLTDSAEPSHRLRPVAPTNLFVPVNARNATVLWQWVYNSYSSLALVCQVALNSHEYKTMRNFSGVGLRSVVLSDFYPDEDYSVQVRCGAQQNFWKWGDWSAALSFKNITTVVTHSAFNEGSDVNLTCSNKTWDQTLYVIWTIQLKHRNECEMSLDDRGQSVDTCKDGKSLRHTSSTQSYLHIPDFTNGDEGVYKCEGVYKGGIDRYEINVAITVPPRTSAWLEQEDNKMVAVCKAERGKPAANISWSHAGNLTDVKTLSDKDGFFTVESRLEIQEGMDTENLSCAISHPYWREEQILEPKLAKGYVIWPRFLAILVILAGFLLLYRRK